MMFWYGDAHWYFWQAALMWAGMVLFWAAMIWLVYSFFIRANRPGRSDDQGPASGGSARDILDQRFARGEIDEDEYRRRRDALDAGSGRPLTGAGSPR